MSAWVSTLSHDGTEAQLTGVENFIHAHSTNDPRLLTDVDGHPTYLVAVFRAENYEAALVEHHEMCRHVRLFLEAEVERCG